MRWLLQEIKDQLNRIESKVETKLEAIMSGLSDLTSNEAQESADITTLVSVVGTLITDLQAALANDDPDAAVEAASQIVAQQDAQLKQITAQLQGSDPGTQAPAPAAPATPPAAA